MMGIRQATKKHAKVPFLEIMRYQEGKIEEDWVAMDSMTFAVQLGLMGEPKIEHITRS